MNRSFTVKPRTIIELTWDIDIFPQEEIITSATILDTKSNEYQSFIQSMVMQFMDYGYELYNDPDYTHESNNGSKSWYYTFLKIENQVEIRVVVNVRVSDHPNKDKPWGSARDRRNKYVDKSSDKLAAEYKSNPKPMRIPVDIIFNDDNYTSYYGAMFALHDQLENLEEQYLEWRKQNNLD